MIFVYMYALHAYLTAYPTFISSIYTYIYTYTYTHTHYSPIHIHVSIGGIYIRHFLDADTEFLRSLINPNPIVLFEKMFRRILVHIDSNPEVSILCTQCMSRLYAACPDIIGKIYICTLCMYAYCILCIQLFAYFYFYSYIFYIHSYIHSIILYNLYTLIYMYIIYYI